MIPPSWDESPAMLTLRDAMAGAARALSRDWYRAWPPAAVPRPPGGSTGSSRSG